MDIKGRARERMEVRIYAQETLTTIIDWIRAVKPSEWLPPSGKDTTISDDELKAQWRDFTDKAGKLIERSWKPAELLIDDLTTFMEEICAKPKETEDRGKGTSKGE